jgi:ABC-type branched-subunit amino acid transport system substrate-binding protein
VLNPFSKYVFSGAALPVESVVSNMATFIADKLKAHSVALLSCDQANCKASVPMLKSALKEKGIDRVTEETFHSGDVDFTGQINAIKAANPDVIQVWGITADGGRIAAQLRRAGITTTLVGDTGLADQSVIGLAGAAAEGMYAMWIGGPQFISDETGTMGEWHRKFAKAFPDGPVGLPNTYSARAYADAYVIAEGFRRAGTDFSPENIIKHFEEMQGFVAGKDEHFIYASPIGFPRSFTPSDHQGNTTMAVVEVKDGKFVSLPQ